MTASAVGSPTAHYRSRKRKPATSRSSQGRRPQQFVLKQRYTIRGTDNLRSSTTASAVGSRTTLYRTRNRKLVDRRLQSATTASAVGCRTALYRSRTRKLANHRLWAATTTRFLGTGAVAGESIDDEPAGSVGRRNNGLARSAGGCTREPVRFTGWCIDDKPASLASGCNE